MEIEDAVGAAIRARLDDQLACAVYDHPPVNASYPYVTFDRHITQPDDDIAEHMTKHVVTLTVWSDTRGPRQVRDILGGIRRALHHYGLSLAAGHCVLCEYARGDATRDGDGVTYMGTALVQVLTDDSATSS